MFQQIEIATGDRDPRMDPRPGDIVAKQMKKGIAIRRVTTRSGDRVSYTWAGATRPPLTPRSLVSSWSLWCRGAVVVSKGEEASNV